jgi:hypothetical protein
MFGWCRLFQVCTGMARDRPPITSALTLTCMICPSCESMNYHPAEFDSVEWLWLVLLRRPYRCRNCRTRFWGFVWNA